MDTMPEIPNCYYRTSIKALILDDQKRFLLTKDKTSGQWDLPGGGLNRNEDPHACISREIQEEMGIPTTWIAANPSYFIALASHAVEKKLITNVIYVTKLQHLDFTPSDECIELGFFSSAEAMNQDLYANVLQFIEMYNPANH